MEQLTTSNSFNTSSNMFEVMEKAYKFSQIMAKSDIIPAHYRSKPENVFVAIQTAYRMNLDPMLVMQNTFVISGKLGMNSTFAISLANSSGLFTNGIRYKLDGEGNSLKVTAYATLKSTNEEISYVIGMKEAIAENWTKNPKYKTLPELMLRYRAATLLIRTHTPEVMNGMHMIEEIEDVVAAKDVTAPKVAINSKLDNFLANECAEKEEATLYSKLTDLIELHHIPQETVDKWCRAGGVDDLEKLDAVKMQSCVDYVLSRDNISSR